MKDGRGRREGGSWKRRRNSLFAPKRKLCSGARPSLCRRSVRQPRFRSSSPFRPSSSSSSSCVLDPAPPLSFSGRCGLLLFNHDDQEVMLAAPVLLVSRESRDGGRMKRRGCQRDCPRGRARRSAVLNFPPVQKGVQRKEQNRRGEWSLDPCERVRRLSFLGAGRTPYAFLCRIWPRLDTQ